MLEPQIHFPIPLSYFMRGKLEPEALAYKGETYAIAIDCEMVICQNEKTKKKFMCACELSIVNEYGHILLNTKIKPRETIICYKTKITGIKKGDLESAPSLEYLQPQLEKLFDSRIIVGVRIKLQQQKIMEGVKILTKRKLCERHLKFLNIQRFLKLINKIKSFNRFIKLITFILNILQLEEYLNVQIQNKYHSSVFFQFEFYIIQLEDARAAMYLYQIAENSRNN